jgi:Spy/CpxP family protein refolding chaperone
MTKWWLIVALPVLLCAQSSTDSQPRPPAGRGMMRPWWDSNVTRDMNLSDTQTKQIRTTVQEFRGRMMDLRATVNKAEGELQSAFNEDPVDQKKANDAIDHLVTARGELMRATSQMDLKLRTVLTAQQWQELQNRQRSWPGPGPGRRRGPGPDGASTNPTKANP